ncbi:MAG: GAF domain-containing protein, partial [Comamonadaceae bacterium]
CLEGAIPAVLATCDAGGIPNVAYISQVFHAGESHVALSFQFFNKTHHNIRANPRATLLLIHPSTSAFYRLHIVYRRTESEGPLFQGMAAQLAGIASHTGMEGVFRLLGADVYEVEAIEQVAGEPLPAPPPPSSRLAALRVASERMARSTSLDEMLGGVLATLGDAFGMRHAMVLVHDAAGRKLYTVASSGYPTSGVGSEVRVGEGVIGVAARERTPVRILHMTNAALYSQAVRSSFEREAPGIPPSTDIPYPGLQQPHSQMAVPVLSAGRLLGVVFVESPCERQFGFEDEDALVTLAGHLGAAIDLLQASADSEPAVEAQPPSRPAPGATLQLRRFKANDSLFIDDRYLIKGVAGAILWKLARDHLQSGRTDFSNRELRLDPTLGLPDVTDNLEARLLLLQRRLQEHGPHLRIEKTGRGRFRLQVDRPLALSEA